MRPPRFWWRPAGLTATLLWPFAQIYGAISGWRMTRPAHYRPPIPVICVGNFVVGGAGKTPTALALARIARGRGLKPGFLTRGYGGRATSPVLVAKGLAASFVGDEALLLAAVAPTVVARDRAAGAKLLAAEGVDLIIMDDGFQNPGLAKDISLVVVDAGAGLGNGRVFPAGPLRAPLVPQMRRTDALLLIGDGTAADPLVRAAARTGKAALRARLKPVRVREWRKEPLLAYAGIGRPEKFFASLADAKATVAKKVTFPDHHRFTEAEAERLMTDAKSQGLRLVTTEKDLARLTGTSGALRRLAENSEAFPVVLEFENPTAVGEMISEAARRVATIAHHGAKN